LPEGDFLAGLVDRQEVGEVVLNGASRSIRPASTSIIRSRVVNGLETEPTRYTVSPVAEVLAAVSWNPKPCDQTTV